MLDAERVLERGSGNFQMADSQALDWLIQHRGEWASAGRIASATGLAPDVARQALEQLEMWGLVQRDPAEEASASRPGAGDPPSWRLIDLGEIQRRARTVRANKMLRELEEWHARWRPMTSSIEDGYRRLRAAVRSAGDSQVDEVLAAVDGCH